MKLGDGGEAFFVKEITNEDEEIPNYLTTSPLQLSPDENEAEFLKNEVAKMKLQNQQNESSKSDKSEGTSPNDKNNLNVLVDDTNEVDNKTIKKSNQVIQNGKENNANVNNLAEKIQNNLLGESSRMPSLINDDLNYLSSGSDNEENGIPIENSSSSHHLRPPRKRSLYKKCIRLTNEQILGLNLEEGRNEAVFSVTTAYQGTTKCNCYIYLWNWDDKLVVSDIDGTITKSDVLGHILPIIGQNWAQAGVAQLFTKIRDNGYKLCYLSARAIGQSHHTQDYLKSVKQGCFCLPDGPLLLSPTSLISALHRFDDFFSISN